MLLSQDTAVICPELRDAYDLHLLKLTGRSEEQDFGITPLTADDRECFTKPVLLTLGGNLSRTDKDARGFAKRATRLGGIIGYEEICIVGTHYSGRTGPSYSGKFNRAYIREENFCAAAYHFAVDYFKPLLVESGEKISTGEAKKRFRNINIMATSFGGVVAEESAMPYAG